MYLGPGWDSLCLRLHTDLALNSGACYCAITDTNELLLSVLSLGTLSPSAVWLYVRWVTRYAVVGGSRVSVDAMGGYMGHGGDG